MPYTEPRETKKPRNDSSAQILQPAPGKMNLYPSKHLHTIYARRRPMKLIISKFRNLKTARVKLSHPEIKLPDIDDHEKSWDTI